MKGWTVVCDGLLRGSVVADVAQCYVDHLSECFCLYSLFIMCWRFLNGHFALWDCVYCASLSVVP